MADTYLGRMRSRSSRFRCFEGKGTAHNRIGKAHFADLNAGDTIPFSGNGPCPWGVISDHRIYATGHSCESQVSCMMSVCSEKEHLGKVDENT